MKEREKIRYRLSINHLSFAWLIDMLRKIDHSNRRKKKTFRGSGFCCQNLLFTIQSISYLCRIVNSKS